MTTHQAAQLMPTPTLTRGGESVCCTMPRGGRHGRSEPEGRVTVPAFSGIDHVALTVTDLAVSVPFYEKVLGSSPTRR